MFKILCIFSQLSEHMSLHYTSNVNIVQQGSPICCRTWKGMFLGRILLISMENKKSTKQSTFTNDKKYIKINK